MLDPNMIILYVDDPAASTDFYSKLLDIQPVRSSPTFAMFLLKSGGSLGLWSKHTVEPEVTDLGIGGELAFEVADSDTVDFLHKNWQENNITIIQPPTMMGFIYAFTAKDPDNHRLRVFALPASTVSTSS